MRRKVKVEITDEEGTMYSLSVHGKFTQDKVLKLMEVVDMLGSNERHSPTGGEAAPDASTSLGRIMTLIQISYAAKEFSSADIAREYEEKHGDPIPLSTVSTYLSRLSDRGKLKRQKFGNSWVYRLVHLPVSAAAPPSTLK